MSCDEIKGLGYVEVPTRRVLEISTRACEILESSRKSESLEKLSRFMWEENKRRSFWNRFRIIKKPLLSTAKEAAAYAETDIGFGCCLCNWVLGKTDLQEKAESVMLSTEMILKETEAKHSVLLELGLWGDLLRTANTGEQDV